MKWWLIVIAVVVLSLIAFAVMGKREPAAKIVPTYDGRPEAHQGDKTLLVAVHAKWASVWRATAEVLASLDQSEYDVMLVDADMEREFVNELGVDIIPTVIVYKNGQEVSRLTNMMDADQLP